ncbi:MAG TPA: N-formylglutamate deformylase [Alphaproteobacteria bacterium]
MTELFHFSPGRTPVLISVPHAGTYIPPEIADRMTPAARQLPDTDWHVERLYDFAASLGVGMIVATHSRYVVDLNRDPSGKPLYPGADNTELVPTTTFAREPVYKSGAAPDAAEIDDRVTRYWRPYHDRLAAELESLHRQHGIAVLWDAHSIPSVVPRFFNGRLPDLNLGSARGTSAAPALVSRVMNILGGAAGFTSVCDGRFTGGYITRRFGRPETGIHALQLELAQACYMDEQPPYRYDADRAAPLRDVLRQVVSTLVEWAETAAGIKT